MSQGPPGVAEVLLNQEILSAISMLILAGLGVAIAYLRGVQSKLSADMAQVKRDSKAIREQTENTHQTNLRDDVDMIARQNREGLAAVTAELRRLSEAQDHQALLAQTRHEDLTKTVGGLGHQIGEVRDSIIQEKEDRREGDRIIREMMRDCQ